MAALQTCTARIPSPLCGLAQWLSTVPQNPAPRVAASVIYVEFNLISRCNRSSNTAPRDEPPSPLPLPCSICFEELDLSRKEFVGLSDQARAFITALLVKDPLKRPSAEEALRHPFLASGSKSVAAERAAGAPLGRTVVSRIQVGWEEVLWK